MIFVPDKIRVGFQERSDTYTGKLGYVIYFDTKGNLRKQTSFEDWRSPKIETEDHLNEPIEGFVLNKTAGGGGGWNSRNTYTRVYDPRGFEFEISIQNLLYILENTNSIKGKGLEGKFVYGWDGVELILIPVTAPEYIEISEFSGNLKNPVKFLGKDLILGATYGTKQNERVVYLGRFECFNRYSGESRGKQYFFKTTSSYLTIKTISDKIIKLHDSSPVQNYAELIETLQGQKIFSPYDEGSDVFEDISLEEISNYTGTLYFEFQGNMVGVNIVNGLRIYVNYRCRNKCLKEYVQYLLNLNLDIEGLHKICKFKKIKKFLKNGKCML